MPVRNVTPWGYSTFICGFTLIGTESFPFPAVINGNREFFEPTEKRDGVLLGSGNQYDSDTNRNNQAVINEACELLVSLIKNAASEGWNHVHQWVKIPSTEKLDGQLWLRNQIKEGLIEKSEKRLWCLLGLVNL